MESRPVEPVMTGARAAAAASRLPMPPHKKGGSHGFRPGRSNGGHCGRGEAMGGDQGFEAGCGRVLGG